MNGDGTAPEGEKPEPERTSIFREPGRMAAADRATLAALSLEAVAEIDRDIARAQARRAEILDKARVLAESAAEQVVLVTAPRGKVDELGYRSFISEMAAMLRIPESTARSQVAEAKTLQRNLPQTREAFAAGEISQAHVRRIVDQSWSLPADAVSGYETAVLPAAHTQTSARFSRTARDVLEKLHPESIVKRRARAEESRCVEFQPLNDGMAFVGVTHTADIASAIYNATIDQAKSLQTASESRTLPQLAADVFADATIAGFVDPQPGTDTPPLPIAAMVSAEAGETDDADTEDATSESADADETSTDETSTDETSTDESDQSSIRMPRIDVRRVSGSYRYRPRPRSHRKLARWLRIQEKRQHTPSRTEGTPRSHVIERPSTRQSAATGTLSMDRALRLAISDRRTEGASVELGTNESLPEAILREVVTAAQARVRACRIEAPDQRGLRSALGVSARRRAIRPTVMVTVPVLSLLGISEEPSTLDGFGPIDVEMASELAANAPSFTRILTHPETGAVLSVGRDSYRVPADLKRALQVRDLTCRFPGCNRKAVLCDLDHTKDWQYGGETCISNVAHFCRKHHTLKHSTRWSVTQDAVGIMTWTSPAGNTYVTLPDGPWAMGSELMGAAPSDDASPGAPPESYGDDPPF